jgi:hypothetical protein
MKRSMTIALLAAFITSAAFAQSRHSRSSVEAEWFTSAGDASAFIGINPRGSLLPVGMYPDLLSPPRISWLGIAPHSNNGRDLVWSADAPPTSVTNCTLVCNGTITVCSTAALAPPLVLREFATVTERDSAWSQLSALRAPWSAKLSIPLGSQIRYAILTPTEHVATPTFVCTLETP